MAERKFQLATGPEGHPLLRLAGFIPVVASAWVILRPAGAALATVLIVFSFALMNTGAMIGTVFAISAIGAVTGLFPWWAGVFLVLLAWLLVPMLALLIPDLLEEFRKDTPLGKLVSIYLLRGVIRTAIPWMAFLAIIGVRLRFQDHVDWLVLLFLVPPVVLTSKGKLWLAVLWYAALLPVWGPDPGVLVLLGLAAAGLAVPLVTPRPRRHIPLRGLRHSAGFGLALLLRRADRAIGSGDTYRAQRLLSSVLSVDRLSVQPDLCARIALVAVDDGRYQDAADAIDRAAKPGPECSRALEWLRAEVQIALNDGTEAAGILDGIVHQAGAALSRSERVCYGLSLASALGGAGQHARSAEAALAALSAAGPHGWTLEQAEARRLAAEAALAQGRPEEALALAEDAQWTLLSNWWTQYLWNRGRGQSRLARALGGPLGRLLTALMRSEITCRNIQSHVPGKEDSSHTLADMDGIPEILALHGQWDLLADLLVLQARHALRPKPPRKGRKDENDTPEERLQEALGHLLRALRELDRNRYTLRNPRDRAAWSARLHEGLALALSLTAQSGDARLQAELIEFGRIQTLPFLHSDDGARSGHVALAVPPVTRVRGTAQVSRYWDAVRPAPVDVEAAAAAVAGPGAWWLSYWQAGSLLYWSLVPPTGPAEGGRIDLSASSALHQALQTLREGLPGQLDGETTPEVDVRLHASALLNDPAAERLNSARLAGLLLPPSLLTALWSGLKTSAPALPLAIAPSAALAFVPWGLLVLNDPHDRQTVRLVHAADWVLAPAASLATSAPRHLSVGPFPLRLAVVDTWQGPGLEELRAARDQASMLPRDVEILGGAHWSSRTATMAALRAAVARTDPASTVLFACHALPAKPDLSAQGGLVLAEPLPDGGPRLFTPADVLSMASDGIALPAQALLLACDSSNLASSAAGEWLTTAPAMLAAGTKTIVTTMFPVIDAAEDPVLAAAVRGQDLRAAVREVQRAGARAWDSSSPSGLRDSPLQWAAYAVVAAHQSAPERARRRDPGLSPRMRDVLLYFSKPTSGPAIHSGDLLLSYLDGPGAEIYGLLSFNEIFALGGIALANKALHAEAASGPAAGLISGELLQALIDARAFAAREGRDIEPEDVLRLALAKKTPAHKLVRAMTLARMQQEEQILNLMEYTLAQGIIEQKARKRTNVKPESIAFVNAVEASICAPKASSPLAYTSGSGYRQ